MFLVSKSPRKFDSPEGTRLALLTILNDDEYDHNESDEGIVCFSTVTLVYPYFWREREDMSYVEVHHCNGLVCLVNIKESIMLSNPILKEYWLLPQTLNVLLYDFTRLGLGLGFGYDSRTNDYKIVRVSGNCNMTSNVMEKKAELYSLNTNSWKEVELPFSNFFLRRLCSEVYCNGAYYWVTFALENVLLCFDMSDDRFHSIPFLDEILSTEAYWRSNIVNWNDSVALFYCIEERRQPATFEMWRMNEFSDLVLGPNISHLDPWLTFHIQ
ncbi:F-box associated interaction domain containing protein [Trema orientale]|uniref:F-box associated interaction domain containing protein n=1 Tax=Trema orientale TaxID=63057 RepID=A0A2P5FL89_TREOI|nr:F-box associated interaction domain containing protein [Trema orientale]